ncbi:MAG: translation initiation factor IF-6 [Methanomassiliicoccaceae archaeon]|jgi:translation initiation factor 6|nr:translation initiation factor IF-6 [Methanomassiliicoccaceae archaeon]
MMRLSRYGGNPNLGVYSAANESLAIISPDASEEFVKDVEEALGVSSIMTTVAGSFVVGSLVAMNSRCAVVSGLAEDAEIDKISSDIEVYVLHSRFNAAGNNILVNDHGAVVNPKIDDRNLEMIGKALGVRCVRSLIAGMDTVGSACKATNKGAICHPRTSDAEMQLISETLNVEVRRTTLNHGSGLLGPCLIANTRGAVVGDTTTPIEMGKLEDALFLY